MPAELEFKYEASSCSKCRETYHYRTHYVVDEPDDEEYKCPECGEILREVRVEKFLDDSDEILSIMQQLDDEFREERE